MGKNIERIYQKFEDVNDFTGSDRRKKYGQDEYRELETYCGRNYPDSMDELLDQINACLASAVDGAFQDGFCFGIKLLIECII